MPKCAFVSLKLRFIFCSTSGLQFLDISTFLGSVLDMPLDVYILRFENMS
eukprot:c40674_g1_i1 orf=246-395(-)